MHTHAEYIDAAKDVFESQSDDIEIDNDAEVSVSDGGAWVQAWVFVSDDDVTL